MQVLGETERTKPVSFYCEGVTVDVLLRKSSTLGVIYETFQGKVQITEEQMQKAVDIDRPRKGFFIKLSIAN
jgi:ribosomal protein L21E